MTSLSKEQPFPLPISFEGERFSDDEFVTNLVTLGRMTARFGYSPPDLDSEYVQSRFAESHSDRSKGFQVRVHLMTKQHPLYRIQNHEYPYIVLIKRGIVPDYPGTFRPARPVDVVLKGDGSVSLEIWNYPTTQNEFQEVLQFEEPPELFDTVEGVVRKIQGRFVGDHNMSISLYGYPSALCPRTKHFLNNLTGEAVREFLSGRILLK